VGGGIKTLQDSGNGGGTVLVTWQEVREGSEETCASSVAEAALGSPNAGFVNVGPISKPGLLARPTGVFLDGAGDGWIVGTRELFTGFTRYGPAYRDSGAWLAFRPAGGAFRAPVALPAGGAATEPFIVGDQAGAVVVGWNHVGKGADLVWGSASGTVSKPAFLPELSISSLGIDETGHVLAGAEFTGRREGRAALLLTGHAGRFSRPRVIAQAPRTPPHQEFPSTIGGPIVRVGPNGQAIITWDVSPNPDDETRHMVAYRFPNGKLTKPARSRYELHRGALHSPAEFTTAVVDGTGRATLFVEHGSRGYTLSVTAGGHFGPLRRLVTREPSPPGGPSRPSVAGNASGELALGWGTRHKNLEYTLGSDLTGFPPPELIAPSAEMSDAEPMLTISEAGEATAVWLQLAKAFGREQMIEAQALTPGASPIQIAVHTPAHH
jgi:hypothetical protein